MSDSENEIHEEEQEQVEQEEHVEEAEENVEEEEQVEEESGEQEVLENEHAAESDDEEFAGFGEEELKSSKKPAKRKVLSDDEAEEHEEEEDVEEELVEEEAALAEGGEELQEQEELVAEEEVAEEQIDEDEVETHRRKDKKKGSEKKSDLEEAIEKHKNKKKSRRKNDDSEALTNIDNTIALLVTEMKNAAAEDRAANEKQTCSIKKLKLLDVVANMLQKGEHHATMIELGILSAMAEWLAPLPDRSLPNIRIREILINTLQQFGEINTDYLKSSGIGKAVMFLYKHPKETKPNKEKLEKLIHDWARPIFNLDGNFKQLSKDERYQRDMEHVKSLQRRTSNEDSANKVDIEDAFEERNSHSKSKKQRTRDDSDATASNRPLRPGDAGFCPRARVPVPSAKDYIIRPKSNLDNLEMQEKKSKKVESRLDKHKKRFVEIKKQGKTNKAVLMSIEGRKLPL